MQVFAYVTGSAWFECWIHVSDPDSDPLGNAKEPPPADSAETRNRSREEQNVSGKLETDPCKEQNVSEKLKTDPDRKRRIPSSRPHTHVDTSKKYT
jgi:hypothetical protein